jgi:hypothetical protein
MDQFNNIETEFKSLRNRTVSSEMKISNAEINLYLDDGMSSAQRKSFELKLSECDKSQANFSKKKAEKEFIEELIPGPTFSSNRRAGLTQELSDVSRAILVEPELSITRKVVKFLNTPVI